MANRMLLLAAAGLGVLGFAAPASAAVTLNGACLSDLTLTAGSTLVSCVGRYEDNALSNNELDNATINSALTLLGYSGPAVDYSAIPAANIKSNLSGNANEVVNFPGLLNGNVYLGVHYGNGNGGPGNSTTFYRITASMLDVFGLRLPANSTATLFASTPGAVPEPSTWAMMIGGFGLIGGAMRRRRGTPALA